MNIELIILIVVLFCAVMSGYTTRVASRGLGGSILSQNAFKVISGVLGLLSLIAVVVWGFINIEWYWVVGSFLLISAIIVPMLMNKSTFSLWFLVQPILDITCICGACYLWFIA